ncbi:alpha/beta hydrolase [Actinophytocola sediminis]
MRRGLVAGAALLTITAAIAAASAAATAAGSPDTPAAPALPAPTGHHPVGTTSLHLTDPTRQDPWVPTAGNRELMVSLWFPATAPGTRRAAYMTPTESAAVLAGTGVTDVEPDVLSTTRTNAFTDVTPAGGTRPLAVLSPGFTWPRTSLTALAEELASNGYVVAAIDHTYENFAMTFPDGRVTACAACELPDVTDFEIAVVESRARDVSFVLDELTERKRAWPGGARIDPTRIAMVGMSLGGASVGETMLTDARVRAGADLDGTMFKPLPETGLARPFMVFGAAGQDESWTAAWSRLTGWKRWLAVTGAIHTSFTDYDLLAQQIGVDLGSELPDTRSVEITRAYVRAFLDLHLLGKPQPMLDRPTTRFPEVGFCAPVQCPE